MKHNGPLGARLSDRFMAAVDNVDLTRSRAHMRNIVFQCHLFA